MNYEHGNPLPSERNGFFGTSWNDLFSYIVKTMIKNSSIIIKLSKTTFLQQAATIKWN